MTLEIARRSHHNPAYVAGQPLGDHVLGHRTISADAGIRTLRDHIDHMIGDRDIDCDPGIPFHKHRQHRASSSELACSMTFRLIRPAGSSRWRFSPSTAVPIASKGAISPTWKSSLAAVSVTLRLVR
jgi:hypothetical protein